MDNKKLSNQQAVSKLLMQPGVNRDVVRELIKKFSRLKDLSRNKPPTKGVFVNYIKDKGPEKLLSWTIHVKERIIKELEKSSRRHNSYKFLLDMEKFQFNQKGPVCPIGSRTLVEKTIPKILNDSKGRPVKEAIASVLAAAAIVEKRYEKILKFGSINLTDINFAEAWSELPSDSVRGLPYLVVGNFADPDIIAYFGSSFKSVFKRFKELDCLITTPGTRFQGSPRWDEAKVRLINIPAVHYQYLMNGLYKAIKKQMMKLPQMAGWLDPITRDTSIMKMESIGKKLGFTPISIDFRSFDTRMFPEIRLAATNILLNVFKQSSDLHNIRLKVRELYLNQYLCCPTIDSSISLNPVDNLLGSGVANTQADGSVMNMILQTYICMCLGYQQPEDLGLTLGDDAVIWVPNSIIEEKGYEGVLHAMQLALDPLNMEIHTKKAYPNTQIFFLQKLYDEDHDIIGEYSLVRNVDSIVWSEHYRKPIRDVKNHMALETIGQISTLNNSMEGRGKTTLKTIIPILIDEWLKIDKALCCLAQKCAKIKDPAGALFGYLVKCVGGIPTIIRAQKLEQYDHKGLLEKFINDSAKAFPVISVIIQCALNRPPIEMDLYGIYGVRDGNLKI